MHTISFYTQGTYYEADANKLRASCDRFKISHTIVPIESQANNSSPAKPAWSSRYSNAWLSFVARKATFIRESLIIHKRPVCWLDADCEFIQDPTLLRATRADFAIYNFFGDPMNDSGEYHPHKLWASSGVVYFAFTPLVMRLVNEWMTQLERASWMVDDQALSWAFNHFRGGKLQTLWLPRSYNRMTDKWPDVEPVINHTWHAPAPTT